MRYIISILFCINWIASNAQEIDSFWVASNRFPNFSRDTGLVLPDFSFIDEKGEKRTLAEFKGKILYIDVWATSCAPCIAKFPDAKQLKNRLKLPQIDTLIQFVNICTGESKSKWKKLLKQHQPIGINLYSNDTTLEKLWNLDAVPRYILVDTSGKIMCYMFMEPDDGGIDYALYAATKGIKPSDAVWIDFRQCQHFRKHRKYTDDLEGQDYARWFNSVASELIEYFKWKQARKQNSR
jgi:Redoxin